MRIVAGAIFALLALAAPARADDLAGALMRVVGGIGQFLFIAFVFVVAIGVRSPSSLKQVGKLLRWLAERGQEAVQRSQTPGEELSAPPSRDPRLAAAPAPASAPDLSAGRPFPPIVSIAIVEEIGRRRLSSQQADAIVSEAGGWSPFR